ncbi:MAG: PA2928 family protein [Chitinophagaceae bacterium]
MSPSKKLITSTIFLILLGFGGCMFLMRGCLAKYDERSALPPVLFFEKNGQQILLAIVKYDKATSYSSGGGMTSKSVSTTYFLQTNDAVSGAKLQEQKLKDHSDIKEYPIEIMGSASQLAWMFVGEPMAFDPFTLDKKADIGILEVKNPQLKGKFPKERRYYKFNRYSGTIAITATDGSKWQLNTASLQATDVTNTASQDPYTAELEAVTKKLEDLKKQIDISGEQDYNRQSGLSIKVRQAIFEQRDILYKKRDSLNKIKNSIEKLQRTTKDRARATEAMQEIRMSQSYNQIKVNSDTLNGKLYGLYSKDEFKKVYDRFEYRTEYDETSRRQFLSATVTPKDDYLYIDNQSAGYPNASQSFLHGGFLLNKQTGTPIHLKNGWLIVHKTEVGKNGLIQVSGITTDGKVPWTANPGLPEWVDWFTTASHLYILGTNNKELSSGECNALFIVDLTTGKISAFDYFTDKPVATAR